MNTTGMTNQEIIDELLRMMGNGEKITLADLQECISTRSIVDPVAGKDAVTVFICRV